MKTWQLRTSLSAVAVLAISGWLALAGSQQKTPASQQQSADALLGAAQYQEQIQGRLEAAISIYRKVLGAADATREQKARAQFRIGACYERLGLGEARKAYEAVVANYADQVALAAEARARLAALAEPVGRGGSFPGAVTRRVWSGDIYGSPSADGRLLTYVDWTTGDLAVRDLSTGQNRRITKKGGWPQAGEFASASFISPDGMQVVYEWYRKESKEVRVCSLTGSNDRVLFRDPEVESVSPAGWSADGKQVLASFKRRGGAYEIALISVADGTARIVKSLGAPADAGLSLSPDGRRIAYGLSAKEDPSQHDIYLLAANGSEDTTLVRHPADDRLYGWTPDGKAILFGRRRSGTWDAWLLPVADGKVQSSGVLVKQNMGPIHPMGFTQKGAFFYGSSTSLSDIYVASIDPAAGRLLSPPRPAAQNAVFTYSSSAWSPDGRYLAYVLQEGPYDQRRFSIRSMETGDERSLPANMARLFTHRFTWSPDGRRLLVAGYDRKNNRHAIYQVDVQTGGLAPLVERQADESYAQPDWSPDGRSIFYYRNQPEAILTRDLQTGEQREILRGQDMVSGAGFFSWALSPDKSRLAFLTVTGKGVPGASMLKVVPVAGGAARELFRVPDPQFLSEVVWTPDGRYLLCFRGADRNELASGNQLDMTKELWSIPADGGQARRIDLPMDKLRWLSIHPDGRRIAFTAGSGITEIWAMESFLPPSQGNATLK